MRFANIFGRVLEETMYEKVHQLKKRARGRPGEGPFQEPKGDRRDGSKPTRASEVSPRGAPRTAGWCASSPGARAPGPRCRGCSSEGASGCWAGCNVTVRPSQLSDRRLPPGRALLPPLGLRDPGTQGPGRTESRPCQALGTSRPLGRGLCVQMPGLPRGRRGPGGSRAQPMAPSGEVAGAPADVGVCGAGEATGQAARLPRPRPTLLRSQRALPGVTAPALPQGWAGAAGLD